ncbi:MULTISPECIES: antibiotic biosynthesis monooxygenase [Rhodococcus]|uniref:antibiotic biosynthesis monooxygenase n=1 Tax=Rhodococcus TaxID=1827 RepID=UPI001E483A69|nr:MULTISPECIES: antibiotic biosynthesis monooxygenase [Rhodococcus]MCD2108569.1 antibiotic biosynthesis monooxygenase [Rhodococcus qingshengii]MCZ4527462.1 antibiotic biosynthesis monooxygenase [Rhodococcus erythropolis]MDV8008257.1 antibiotic biosynthesis monooxygenase [Rhodococcus sp. IEGM 1318]
MFVLQLTYLADPDVLTRSKPDHIRWLREQINAGTVVAAGPRDGGGGVVITSDLDDEAVDKLVASDPWTVDGLARYDRIHFASTYSAPGVFPRPNSDEVTLINVALTDDPQKSLAALNDAVDHVAHTATGFLGSRLLRSTQNDSIINFARWNSLNEFEAIFDDPEFTTRYAAFAETTTEARYRLYRSAHIISPES